MNGLLKFITCGSVDDGKSTLIGHILYDAKLLYTDQERALELDSKVGSRNGEIDYSLLLDGLMAEREQGITIDVAYRYFTTERRSFIVADTPGHEQYTRNMAVGASFADLAVILVDAVHGVQVQTRRHARICRLMGIQYFVFAVNKMDLVEYREARFREIAAQIAQLQKEVALEQVQIIPLSATEGDNVTHRTEQLAWYDGVPLLEYLETIDVQKHDQEQGFYMPVQRVCRPDHTFRGFQGQIECGSVSVGDAITMLPSGEQAVVKDILVMTQSVETAYQGQAVTISLNKEIDVSRGCVIMRNADLAVCQKLVVSLLWMDDEPSILGKDYLIKLGTKTISGIITHIRYAIDVNSGEKIAAEQLNKNGLAVCEIMLTEAIVADTFVHHKTMGELIMIDRITDMTAACGVVEETEEKDAPLHGYEAFFWNGLKVRGSLFEEYYYNPLNRYVFKDQPIDRRYTVGDLIPTTGKSYCYPASMDIIALQDLAAVCVREHKIAAIIALSDYQYAGFPLLSEDGFAVQADDAAQAAVFLEEYYSHTQNYGQFAAKWMSFDTYRTVVICADLDE